MSRENPGHDLGFETRAIHSGQEPDATTGAIVPPISLATTFAQDGVGVHRGYRVRAAAATRPAARSKRALRRSRERATDLRSRADSPPRTRCCARSNPATT